MRLLLLAPVLLLAAACGSSGGGSASPGASAGGDSLAGGISRAQDDLVVELDRADGSPVRRATLTCAGAVDGDHPRAQAACDHLAGLDDPFKPLPADMMCTEIYGGPETAHVTGVWGGQVVDLRLSRTNGCYIGQWDSLGPLLDL